MKKMKIIIVLFLMSLINVNAQYSAKKLTRLDLVQFNQLEIKLSLLKEGTFRYPVGDSIGTGYKIVQKFGNDYKNLNKEYHAGVDINDYQFGNTDLGDPIYSMENGVVADAFTDDYLAIYYKYKGKIIKILYYHCDTVYVKAHESVKKGQLIATIGNSKGVYSAHLHLEVMRDTSIYFQGYVFDRKELINFIDPEEILTKTK